MQGLPGYQVGPDPTDVNDTMNVTSTTGNQGWFAQATRTQMPRRVNIYGALRPPAFYSVLDQMQPPRVPDVLSTDATSYSASRQLMARHLYVMMLLLIEEGYSFPAIDTSTSAADRTELTYRRIAQWAINVVDFRDKDAVMTPFEYDLTPFTDATGSNINPWNVDGDLSTPEDSAYRRVVWGAEAPDLLLTETLAFHDRGVKDTVLDTSTQPRGNGMSDDETLDQYRIPQGSLFLEFYNPRNLLSNNPVASLPNDLYDTNGQLKLDMLAGDRNNGTPVWRVLITERQESDFTPSSIIRQMAGRVDTINFQPTAVGGGAAPTDFTADPQAGLQNAAHRSRGIRDRSRDLFRRLGRQRGSQRT